MERVSVAARLTTAIVLTIALGIVMFLLPSCSRTEEPSRSGSEEAVATAAHYTLPGEGTTSLVQSLEAQRARGGQVNIVGSLLLPQDTQVWVELFHEEPTPGDRYFAMSKPSLGPGGSLTAGPFDLPKAGPVWVLLDSRFNGAWQSSEILELVGSGGSRLPASLLVPYDPEFPEAGGYFEHAVSVNVPPLSPEGQAIQAVKSATLFVKGKGQAVDTVAEIVDFFTAPGLEFYPGEWGAEEAPDGKWTVHLQHRWGEDQKTASWEYDPATGTVKYLDPTAKMLSWIPED